LRRELAREPDETTVSCLMVLGLTAGDAHRLPEARAAFEEALAVAEKLPGDNRQARALVLSNLGEALVDAKEYERAVEMSSQAVELQRSIDREPNPFVTATLNDKARALTNLGRFDEARSSRKRNTSAACSRSATRRCWSTRPISRARPATARASARCSSRRWRPSRASHQ
jgi:tetratricopeptide (TPR) repeat protein